MSINGHNPYNLFILTIDYSKNFTTVKLLTVTVEHMAMFVVKYIHIQINGHVMSLLFAIGSANFIVLLHQGRLYVGLNQLEMSVSSRTTPDRMYFGLESR